MKLKIRLGGDADDDAFPHSSECGPIEAEGMAKVSEGTQAFPHSSECGPIEARRGPAACINDATVREDELIGNLEAVISQVFDDIDGMVAEAMAELTKSNAANREEAGRLRREVAELDTLSSGLARQIANPALPPVAVTELGRQLEKIGERRSVLDRNPARLLDQGQDDVDAMAARVRGEFEAARDRLASWSTGAALNTLAAELLGASLVTTSGGLLPMPLEQKESPVNTVSVHGAVRSVTPAGFEPASRP